MNLALIILPLLAAALVWFMKPGLHRARILPVAGILHLALVVIGLSHAFHLRPDAWLRLDPLGGWALLVVSAVFNICALYAPAYLALRMDRNFALFGVCMLTFLGMASLVATSRHPAVLWVGMEATTLSVAPLIYYNHNKRSLEATWKYLILGSVGMALALLGTFFVAYSAQLGGLGEPIYFDRLVANAPRMSGPWLRAGFVLLLVGYGTKMGLAPMHTWKPDAYGETPGIVGTILAGGVTTCAFLALLRHFSILAAAGEAPSARHRLAAMGVTLQSGTVECILAKHGWGRNAAKSQFAEAFSTAEGFEEMLAAGLAKVRIGQDIDADGRFPACDRRLVQFARQRCQRGIAGRGGTAVGRKVADHVVADPPFPRHRHARAQPTRRVDDGKNDGRTGGGEQGQRRAQAMMIDPAAKAASAGQAGQQVGRCIGRQVQPPAGAVAAAEDDRLGQHVDMGQLRP